MDDQQTDFRYKFFDRLGRPLREVEVKSRKYDNIIVSEYITLNGRFVPISETATLKKENHVKILDILKFAESLPPGRSGKEYSEPDDIYDGHDAMFWFTDDKQTKEISIYELGDFRNNLDKANEKTRLLLEIVDKMNVVLLKYNAEILL
ncbi:MAG: hypothetical protein EOM30_12180 [Clostridia bacterium]|nr:hypothetical protein [Clostridia bacterium]NLS84687.1 hypothetical protein [Oscillospiraceae bacterium]